MRWSPGSGKQSREPNFDRVARVYRWAEYAALGPLLQWTRTGLLQEVKGRSQVLVLGDGDGRFLARLLRKNPEMQAMAVDTSAAMLGLLRDRCTRVAEGRVRTRHASALEVLPARDTDLIVTHFFLDCLTQAQVDGLVAAYAAIVTPGTQWLLSDFAYPRSGWLRPLAEAYVRGLYAVFGVLTGMRVRRLPDPQSALRAAGFARLARRERMGGLLYNELWELQHRGGSGADRRAIGRTEQDPDLLLCSPSGAKPVCFEAPFGATEACR